MTDARDNAESAAAMLNQGPAGDDVEAAHIEAVKARALVSIAQSLPEIEATLRRILGMLDRPQR